MSNVLSIQNAQADDRPLTPREYAQVQRLFSDPFSLPVAYKTWLISYLETSDLNLPIGSIMGLAERLRAAVAPGFNGLPIGAIVSYGGTTVPPGTLRCNGASYLRADQQKLFDVIGTRYGTVDAAHFNVPNLAATIPNVDFLIVN